MRMVVVVDVLEVDLGVAHRVPGLPGDAEDHERDHETDYRIGDVEAESDDRSARENAEADKAVDPSVIAVGDERRALEAAPGPQPNLSGNLVPDETDHPCRRKQPQMRQRPRVDEPLDR